MMGEDIRREHHGIRQISLARLAEFPIMPKRRLGQNFLIDDNILSLILDRLRLSEGEVVLEVGAGLGVLTAALADEAPLYTPLRWTVRWSLRSSRLWRDVAEGPPTSRTSWTLLWRIWSPCPLPARATFPTQWLVLSWLRPCIGFRG